ncbi:hypothetical protein DMH02_018355, partial [Streptomyces sp. WAC 00631]|nr:hypothetical protein [Streptomyces sp. WAC 00631]
LDTDRTEDFPRPALLLTLAAEHVQSSDRTTQRPPELTRAVAQAAGHRAASAHTLHIPGDPHPEQCNSGDFCGGCGHAGCGGRR